MKPDRLLRDPVFQLNLLLWMAKDQPGADWRVRPLLREHGFEIQFIEQPFPFPPEVFKTIQATGLDVALHPEPELILGRPRDLRALYFEAKSQGFGVKSSNCRQARGHLLAAGPPFAEALKPLVECLFCLVLPLEDQADTAVTLVKLVTELEFNALEPGPFSVHGLSFAESQLRYQWDQAYGDHAAVEGQSAIVMEGLAEDTDPSPLLLVYSDEDCPDGHSRDFYRSAMIGQAHACLLCELHAATVESPYAVTADELLHKMTDGIFKFLGRTRQKGLRQLIRHNLFAAIARHWDSVRPGAAKLDKNSLVIQWASHQEKDAFLDWLGDRRTSFAPDRPPESTPTLFDPPEEGPRPTTV